MTLPWSIPAGIVVLALSLLPAWMIDLANAPFERDIRFWTTVAMAALLFGTFRRIPAFRWVLAGLLGLGIVASVYSFAAAGTFEVESAIITLAQIVGVGLLFVPDANRWFAEGRGTGGDADAEAEV